MINQRRLRTEAQYDSSIIWHKSASKGCFDKRRKTTDKPVRVGDQILTKQEKITTKPLLNPYPFKVTSVIGNFITAANRDKRMVSEKTK